MPTPEALARLIIDQKLTAAGWIVQDFKHLNLGAGPGVAVREFQTASGSADYVLFVDLRDPDYRSRRVFSFHRPETLREWISCPDTLRGRLREMSEKHLLNTKVYVTRRSRRLPIWSVR